MCPVQEDTNGTTGTFVLVNEVQQGEEDQRQEEGGIQVQDYQPCCPKTFVIAAVNHQTEFMIIWFYVEITSYSHCYVYSHASGK